MVRLRPLPWRPGALALLAALREEGTPTALVTTASRSFAQSVVDALPFVGFDLLVCGGDVARSKPAPDPYLFAAELLTVDITRCVVIEDSLPGLTAGHASGATTIGVPHRTELPTNAGGWTIWPTLEGRGTSDVALSLQQRSSG